MFIAAYYDIRYVEVVNGEPKNNVSNFDQAKKLADKHIRIGSLSDTKESHETYEIILKSEVFSNPRYQYYVMAKAVNHVGKIAKHVSNIVLVPEIETEIADTSTPETSTQNTIETTEIICIIGGCLIFAAVLLGCILHWCKKNKKSAYPVTQ